MNKQLKKLALNKETIRSLTDHELTIVAGGVTAGNGCGTNTCNTCLLTYPCYHSQQSLCGTKNCVTVTSPVDNN